MREIKSGDVLRFLQEDGNWLTIFVYPNCIGVKAENPGINLKIDRVSSFMAKAIAVDGR